MSQKLSTGHCSGPPNRNSNNTIHHDQREIIEISDSSDVEDDEYAVKSPQVPGRQPQPLQLQYHHPSPFLGANNQMNKFNPALPPYDPLPSPPDMMSPNPIKNEEPGVDWNYWTADDQEVDRLMWEHFARPVHDQAWNRSSSSAPSSESHQPMRQAPGENPNQPAIETKDECIQAVVAVFPKICLDHVAELYATISSSSDRLVAHILDKIDTGNPYPIAKDVKKNNKRKRVLNEEEEAQQKYEAVGRVIGPASNIQRTVT